MLIREYAEILLIFPMVSVLITLRFSVGDAMPKRLFSLLRVIILF
ncbi:hypothetical protein NIES22_28140 [Calothrix brevissima NIES-22]|nr:hypothetical protein NIES22_28140 [Calothrix brevissima NIES-22]